VAVSQRASNSAASSLSFGEPFFAPSDVVAAIVSVLVTSGNRAARYRKAIVMRIRGNYNPRRS